jgi:hypothetical protein
MFRLMSALFSSKGISALFGAALLLLCGCDAREPAVITPPKDAAAVIEPFLKELAAGQKDNAAAFVSTAATDELMTQFGKDHQKLAAAGKLTPRFVVQPGADLSRLGKDFDADGSEVTLVYADKTKGKWTTATVRVYRYRDEPFKVEYWRVTNQAPQPALPADLDSPEVQRTAIVMGWMMGGFALLGLFGIAGLIWMVRRKPHLLVPDEQSETRQPASTLREE